ncbi:hypothetical protein [Oryza sativa Japonica Group]|uniref:Uncharacterized protein n=1 Tax=Oryza sativa subsp. japonica TaxID=39947 RepID=Q5JLU7_ORYSJ|nr:hypothetical protein [Oryza sativa Japonica Group]
MEWDVTNPLLEVFSLEIRDQAIQKNLADELVPPRTSARREVPLRAARSLASCSASPRIVSDYDGGLKRERRLRRIRWWGGQRRRIWRRGGLGGDRKSGGGGGESGGGLGATATDPVVGRAAVANPVAGKAAAAMAGEGDCSSRHVHIVVVSDIDAGPPSACATGRRSSFRSRHWSPLIFLSLRSFSPWE